VLDQHRGHSIVIGGIAVIARGVPRVTRDVDVAFSGAEVTLSGLLTDLNEAGIIPRIDDAIGFAGQSQVLLARHAKTGVDIDVSLAWLPFEMEARPAYRHSPYWQSAACRDAVQGRRRRRAQRARPVLRSQARGIRACSAQQSPITRTREDPTIFVSTFASTTVASSVTQNHAPDQLGNGCRCSGVDAASWRWSS
jgi:hypothetical protein